MTRTVPVRRLISLMTFALGLSIALPSHAVTVAEAVAAARNTQLPDIDGIMANHDGVLDAVGGGSTEGLDDVKNLWADGKGTLTGSAEATVIECRSKTDTTCRAIQVLDKGFPERPVIGEDVLAGRDEIVNNPTVTPDDNDTCKDVTIEADPVEVTKTCRAGGWWNEKACRIGPVEIGKVTAKYFACAEGEGTSSERSCLTTVSGKPASSVWTERCFFGKESSAASGTVTEETSAVARAIFSGVCTSTDATTETVKCSEVLESNNDHGCVLGDKTTARVNGEYSLSHDPCSDGDVLIGQHTCGNSSYLAIQVKGFKSTRISLGYTLRNIAHLLEHQSKPGSSAFIDTFSVVRLQEPETLHARLLAAPVDSTCQAEGNPCLDGVGFLLRQTSKMERFFSQPGTGVICSSLWLHSKEGSGLKTRGGLIQRSP